MALLFTTAGSLQATTITVSISGLTITNGSARLNSGGGIFNDHATLTVNNCALSGNVATHFGGGIMNDHGSLTIASSTLSGNFGAGVGGAIYNDGRLSGSATLIVRQSTLSGNISFDQGDGIFNNGSSGTTSVQIVNSTLNANWIFTLAWQPGHRQRQEFFCLCDRPCAPDRA